jgi:hypothetical protein
VLTFTPVARLVLMKILALRVLKGTLWILQHFQAQSSAENAERLSTTANGVPLRLFARHAILDSI